MVIYHIGDYPAKERTGRNIHPGYIVVKASNEIAGNGGEKEGKVHGELCMSFFKELPSTMAKTYKTKMAGFAF